MKKERKKSEKYVASAVDANSKPYRSLSGDKPTAEDNSYVRIPYDGRLYDAYMFYSYCMLTFFLNVPIRVMLYRSHIVQVNYFL